MKRITSDLGSWERGTSNLRRRGSVIGVWTILICAVVSTGTGMAQQAGMSKDDQVLIAAMLRTAHDDVRKYYYDPKIRGLDWDGLYQKYEARIPKASAEIAAVLRNLSSLAGSLFDHDVTIADRVERDATSR